MRIFCEICEDERGGEDVSGMEWVMSNVERDEG